MFRKLHNPPGGEVEITIDDQRIRVEKGESLAAVLLRLEPLLSRKTPVKGSARAPYCMMGVCFDCLANVAGLGLVRSCLTPAAEGMKVSRQVGRRDISHGGQG